MTPAQRWRRQEEWRQAELPTRFWEPREDLLAPGGAATAWMQDVVGNVRVGRGFALLEAADEAPRVGAAVVAELFKAAAWSGTILADPFGEWPFALDWFDFAGPANRSNQERAAASGWLFLRDVPFKVKSADRSRLLSILRHRHARSWPAFLHFVGRREDVAAAEELLSELSPDSFVR